MLYSSFKSAEAAGLDGKKKNVFNPLHYELFLIANPLAS